MSELPSPAQAAKKKHAPGPNSKKKTRLRPNSKKKNTPPSKQQKKNTPPAQTATRKNTLPAQTAKKKTPAQTAKKKITLGRGGGVFFFAVWAGSYFCFAVWAGPGPTPKQQKITPEKPKQQKRPDNKKINTLTVCRGRTLEDPLNPTSSPKRLYTLSP